jgi:hypothetical protein
MQAPRMSIGEMQEQNVYRGERSAAGAPSGLLWRSLSSESGLARCEDEPACASCVKSHQRGGGEKNAPEPLAYSTA